ncbi:MULTISPECIES: LysR family transcriptional regulator [Microbacterium]|uniref:LysR family transcriptional regulator n=1 Tax=Microbacterium TaxID=33882 RepID=UPI002785AA2B|nr:MULTISPECIES: LysR family transcriptional regulator [Microbacterium]MDQ1085236.1 DNA-binding transcriptional LysR family regulator [Microbacterium sp. SORGH_AS_0344]MDQ1169458.1 DNA-binding transcriptional LysR family regulator [Microbacterium proteolyticum]
MIDLDAVQSLRAVAREGSVAAAATALGFTPSAVSQQIKRLERGTGVTLLERVGRGIALTDAGTQLVVGAAPILADLERLRADLHTPPVDGGSVTGEVRLAAFSTVVRGLLAPLLVDLAEAHPGLHLALRESEPWETVALVASGQRDLGVAHQWGGVALTIPENIVVTPLFTDVADVILHRDHPLATRTVLRPGDLADQAWVATFDTTICRQWLRRLFDGVRNAPRVVYESMEFENHLELARTGQVVALVPRLGRGALGPDLVAIPTVDPASTRDIVAVHRRTQSDSPALRTVLAALTSAGARLPH